MDIELLAQPGGSPIQRCHREFEIDQLFLCAKGQVVQANDLFSVVGVQHLAEMLSKQRVGRNAQYLFARWIHISETPIFVQIVNDIARILNKSLVCLTAYFKLLSSLPDLFFQLAIQVLKLHIVVMQLQGLFLKNAFGSLAGQDLSFDPSVE